LAVFDFDLTRNSSVWVMTLYGFFWYMQKYTADQTLVQRYLVAKSDRDAIQGRRSRRMLCVPAWMLFMLIARSFGVTTNCQVNPPAIRKNRPDLPALPLHKTSCRSRRSVHGLVVFSGDVDAVFGP